ncbi:Eukaryotic translation initiation factor 2B delta subunit [Spironucleus salmonicida]|uniref:Eukaryotic translation initiation factor 2B delta subunit n=1 Tax=Spironucleus salmonicida TaxID=348837 RepID=V6M0Q3_9EUKA|nr:Eukaryotic translation initiation factor 2B delta subunit [Spironucleus salmonicida]|eukprot:EST46699.1 eukaryotic translation initiation factor 2B delta subunit [Spironucleus salmonicida]
MDDSIFNTEDVNLVETHSFEISKTQKVFNFPKCEIPGFEHLIASQNPSIPHTVYLGYQVEPNQMYLPYQGNLQPFNMEGRRFIDMLSNNSAGINLRIIQLVRAVKEHFSQFQRNEDTSRSESDSFTEIDITSITLLYTKIISEFYGFIPRCFSHFLDFFKLEKLENQTQLTNFCRNYINFNIIDAENVIYKHLIKLIEPNCTILISSESQLIFRAIIVAAKKTTFNVILTDKIPNQAKQLLQNIPNITIQQCQLHSIPFTQISKFFFNCFELSNTGNALVSSQIQYISQMCAKYKIPSFLVCEKLKFSCQILLDSTVRNAVSEGSNLDFVFGILEHQNISGIVCEFGIVGIDGFADIMG